MVGTYRTKVICEDHGNRGGFPVIDTERSGSWVTSPGVHSPKTHPHIPMDVISSTRLGQKTSQEDPFWIHSTKKWGRVPNQIVFVEGSLPNVNCWVHTWRMVATPIFGSTKTSNLLMQMQFSLGINVFMASANGEFLPLSPIFLEIRSAETVLKLTNPGCKRRGPLTWNQSRKYPGVFFGWTLYMK